LFSAGWFAGGIFAMKRPSEKSCRPSAGLLI